MRPCSVIWNIESFQMAGERPSSLESGPLLRWLEPRDVPSGSGSEPRWYDASMDMVAVVPVGLIVIVGIVLLVLGLAIRGR